MSQRVLYFLHSISVLSFFQTISYSMAVAIGYSWSDRKACVSVNCWLCYSNIALITTSRSTEIQNSSQGYQLVVSTSIHSQWWVGLNVTCKLHTANKISSTSVKVYKHPIWSQKHLNRTSRNWYFGMYWSPVLTVANLESDSTQKRKYIFCNLEVNMHAMCY